MCLQALWVSTKDTKNNLMPDDISNPLPYNQWHSSTRGFQKKGECISNIPLKMHSVVHNKICKKEKKPTLLTI